MSKAEIMKTVTRSLYKAKFKIKQHSPELLVAAGIGGTIGAAVLACKATTKLSAILEESKEQIDQIHDVMNDEEMCEKHNYTQEDGKKDLAIVYAQTGLKVVKLYGPSVLLGAASLGCILTSHNILRKRNIALAAAYATVDRGFKEYRSRVIERFGKDLDRELKHNIKAQVIEETIVNEDGTESVVEKTVEVGEPSEYARFFDDGCSGWTKNAEMNLVFLKQQQNYANELLKRQGYLFLNDVYKMLGIPLTQAGQIVGWIYDDSGEYADGYVDFGIYDLYNEKKRDFVNGYEKVILLDFNVQGNVAKLLP